MAGPDQTIEERQIFEPDPVLLGEPTHRLENLTTNQRTGTADHVLKVAPRARGPKETHRSTVCSTVGPRVAIAEELDASRGNAVCTGEARGAHETVDRFREQDVVVVEE